MCYLQIIIHFFTKRIRWVDMIQKLTSLTLSQSESKDCGLCDVYISTNEWLEQCHWWGLVKNQRKLVGLVSVNIRADL